MAEYYYTVASLPMLILGQEPSVSLEYFLENCRYTMNENDYETLLTAGLIPDNASEYPAVVRWQNFERTLRNELAAVRSQKTGIDYDTYRREGETVTGVADAVREASSAANPEIGEDILDAARWRFLDELESSHNFDLTKLIVYYIKLQISERRKMMNEQNGREKYGEIYQGITDKIHQSYDGEL
ncbi:MAG: DUF2764 family protein [Spirochaetales bacterium]|uniref:DUF2764 family protein n=1 Tax=Candidatus Thalassospirochaeta sargassi TaxID=3119039 RepID=A0AAJ1ID81_9SPIO|nr:DUF2764 family protein [Spirochaetales bacterium]